jgi:hypothetical protein
MDRRVLVLATLLGLAASARAETAHEPPAIAILVGPGIRRAWLDAQYAESHDMVLPAFSATIGYRVSPHVSLGVHAAGARSSDQEQYDGTMDTEREDWNVIAADAGVAATYEEDRFTVTPWVGRRFSRRHHASEFCLFRNGRTCTDSHETEWTSDFLAYGLIASVVPLRELPVAVFAELQSGTGGAVLGPESTPRYNYAALTIGVAYRR